MGMSFEDMTASSLFVVLLDDDKYGNDFLGAAKISLGLVSSRPSRGSLETVSENRTMVFESLNLISEQSSRKTSMSFCGFMMRTATWPNHKCQGFVQPGTDFQIIS